MTKQFYLFAFLVFFINTISAQMTHTIDGKSYELTEEITGKASLFYVIADGEYRYFIKKDNELTELTNTKGENDKYLEEYKGVLNILTADGNLDFSKVKLTLASLKTYIDEYNKAIDVNYKMQAARPKPKARLGAFIGMSNNPFVINEDNLFTPTFGLDFEAYDVKASRHSITFGFKHSLKVDDLKDTTGEISGSNTTRFSDYSSNQFSVGYRFRIINKESFALYPQVTLATYTIIKQESTIVNNGSGNITTQGFNSSTFDAPVILAIGADIKLGNGFLTLSANELLALINIENQGNFPMDLRVGYKFNL